MSTYSLLVESFLPLLSEKRFLILPYWKTIGQVIFNLLGEDGFEIFFQISSKHGKTREECKNSFACDVDEAVTIRTLGFYARDDSSSEFYKLHNVLIEDSILESLDIKSSILDTCVDVLSFFVWLDFLCIGDEIYLFEGSYLVKDRNALKFKSFIYERLKSWTLYKLETKHHIHKNLFLEILEKLETHGFIENVKRELKLVISSDVIPDQNTNKVATKNGVFILDNDNISFVKGKPEDFITKGLFVNYNPNANKSNLISFLSNIFPDPIHMNQFIKICCSLLDIPTKQQISYFVGNDTSGKTAAIALIEATLGGYLEFDVSRKTKRYVRYSKKETTLEKNNIVLSDYINISDIQTDAIILPFTKTDTTPNNILIDSLSEPFLSLLIEYYPIYKRDGFFSFFDGSPFILDDVCDEDENFTQMYASYKLWIELNHSEIQTLSSVKFKELLLL